MFLSHAETPTFERPSLLGRVCRPPGWAVHAYWHTRGTNQQVTHESPPHNSQLVTLKLRLPPTLAWQEFERGYEQKGEKDSSSSL